MEKVMDDGWLMCPPHLLCLSLSPSITVVLCTGSGGGAVAAKSLCADMRYPTAMRCCFPEKENFALYQTVAPLKCAEQYFMYPCTGPQSTHMQDMPCDLGP